MAQIWLAHHHKRQAEPGIRFHRIRLAHRTMETGCAPNQAVQERVAGHDNYNRRKIGKQVKVRGFRFARLSLTIALGLVFD